MARLRLAYFALAALFLAGVVVQFLLAGLGVFGAQSFDAHILLGLLLVALALVLLVVGILARLPRPTLLLTLLLLVLAVAQVFLAHAAAEVAALHVLNALAVFVVAHLLVRRSRAYMPSKSAA